MKKFLQLVLLFLFSSTVVAQTTIDGMTFYPNVDESGNEDGTCYLSKYEKGSLDVVVPGTVYINNNEYTVTKIGAYSFMETWNEENKISTVKLPNSIISIGESAFEYCEGLTKINLPEGLQVIENHAFNYCQSLTIDNLPPTLKYIGDFAFSTDAQLIIDNNLIIPASVIHIGRCNFDLYLSSLIFEYSDEELEIEEDAFRSNYYLNYIEVNRKLNVKPGAFREFRANFNLAIGENVTDISWLTPSLAMGLTQIVCNSPTPPFADFSQEQYSKIKLFIPRNLKSDYENDPKWAFFKNIIDLNLPFNEYNISTESETLTLNVGESVEIDYSLVPPIDSQVAFNQDGYIYGKQVVNLNLYDSKGVIWGSYPGETNVRFSLMLNNNHAACHVIVLQPATSIILNKNEIILEKGDTKTLFANVAPTDVSDPTVTWTSSNSDVATVEDGVVTAINSGVCQILATTHNGLTAECKVIVNPILVESIEIKPDILEVEEGQTVQLITTVLPEYATEKTVEWISDDSSIAEVNNEGLVKIISSGLTIIRAKATDGSGVEGICEVTGIAGVESILAENNNMNLYSIDGSIIFRKVTKEQLCNLTSGIYILTDGTKKIKFIKN